MAMPRTENLPRQDDQDLIRAHLHGDPKAFPVLLKRYEKRIFFLIRQYFPQVERAEEVFQEVFMKVVTRLDKFEATGSFRAWLYTVCRNHCIDRIRYHARRPETPESPLEEKESGHAQHLTREQDPQEPSDSVAYARELGQYLQEALDKLPLEQRDTFLLKERSGMTFEEIAQSMEVSVNTVKSRMRYAIASLRRILKNKSFIKEARS